jgi:LuxR family quorum sensing-dependent transcriptional regulator
MAVLVMGAARADLMKLKDLTFDFIEASRQAASPDALLDETLAFCGHLEIEGVFVADVPDPGESIDAHILLRGWNPQWIDRYAERGYVHLDPVARELKKRVAPYLWTEACDRRLEREEKLVMGEAREYGLSSGISVPIYDMDGRQSCVSFAGHNLALDNERRGAVQIVAFFTHARLRELRRRAKVRLSPRERDCLSWAAKGKTSWETAQILHLSEQTTRAYITQAMRKLQASSRAQAVAQAIRQGFIT